MKKTLLLLPAIAAVCVMALPAVASAEKGAKYSDKTGRFGIGGDTSLGGVGGLSARFQVAKNFGIQGILGFSRISFDSKDDSDQIVQTDTTQQFAAAIRGDIGLAYTNKAALSIIFGVDIFNDSFSTDFNNGPMASTDESNTRFAFEAGLKAEYHFTDFFSIHTEVGFVFALVNRASEAGFIASRAGISSGVGGDSQGDGSVIVFGIPDTFGNAGFTFWFK